MRMWNSSIKILFFLQLLTLLLYSPNAFCNDSTKMQVKIAIDSTPVELRNADPVKQGEIMSDPDYKYDRKEPAPNKNWWQRFKEWFWEKISDLFSGEGGEISLKIIQWLLIVAAIVVIVFLLLKNNIRALFYGKSAAIPINFREFDEDIHKINFNELIAAALSEKDYRRAVRLHFLKLLKELTDKNLIVWKADKTNNDYFIELSNASFRGQFKELAFLYEHIWYGNFDMDESNFNSSIEKFKSFKV